MGIALAIASGKGGVGKSQAAINLGSALAMRGKSVIIVDANLPAPDLSMYLDVRCTVTLNDVLTGKAKAEEATYSCSLDGLQIMPANTQITAANVFSERNFGSLVQQLKRNNDFVIIDTAPGLSEDVTATLRQVDEVLLISTPEHVSLVDAFKTSIVSQAVKTDVYGVIINRAGRFKGEAEEREIKAILDESKILGRIPEDTSVPVSSRKLEPVIIAFPHSPAARAFKRIAARMVGEHYEENPVRERLLHFLNMR